MSTNRSIQHKYRVSRFNSFEMQLSSSEYTEQIYAIHSCRTVGMNATELLPNTGAGTRNNVSYYTHSTMEWVFHPTT